MVGDHMRRSCVESFCRLDQAICHAVLRSSTAPGRLFCRCRRLYSPVSTYLHLSTPIYTYLHPSPTHVSTPHRTS